MKITFRYFEGCPNWQTADRRLGEALASKGVDAEIDYELVSTLEEAERLRFRGSPTILIHGIDPFPAEETSYADLPRVPNGGRAGGVALGGADAGRSALKRFA